MRERIRRRRSCLWKEGDLTRERKKKKKQRREFERDMVKDKKNEISTKKR